MRCGGGEVLYGLKGQIELYFSWNLCKSLNNHVKMYALLQEIILATSFPIRSLIIIEDSNNQFDILL